VFSTVLTMLLTEAGDLAAAEQVCAAGLARSRELGDLWNLGHLLSAMAFLDLRANRVEDAASRLREQIQITLRSGFRSELLTGLDCCAYLCAATDRFAEAATVWRALDVLRGPEGPRELRPYVQPARREETLREVRQALGPDRARAAEERGAAMSLTTAAEYALLLTAAGPEPPAAGSAPGRLSARERELVTLVARGHTDAQIAAQLCISVRTVNSHLDRIRDKTGLLDQSGTASLPLVPAAPDRTGGDQREPPDARVAGYRDAVTRGAAPGANVTTLPDEGLPPWTLRAWTNADAMVSGWRGRPPLPQAICRREGKGPPLTTGRRRPFPWSPGVRARSRTSRCPSCRTWS
jgi:DNA-binding CsgD family transcriptional regulator